MKPPAVYRSPVSALWFHDCPRCGHITAHHTRATAEADQDRHADVCPGQGLR